MSRFVLTYFCFHFRTGDNVQHFKIFKDDDRKYHLWIRKFSSLNLLVEHHKTNSVSKTQEIFLNEVDFRVSTCTNNGVYSSNYLSNKLSNKYYRLINYRKFKIIYNKL